MSLLLTLPPPILPLQGYAFEDDDSNDSACVRQLKETMMKGAGLMKGRGSPLVAPL